MYICQYWMEWRFLLRRLVAVSSSNQDTLQVASILEKGSLIVDVLMSLCPPSITDNQQNLSSGTRSIVSSLEGEKIVPPHLSTSHDTAEPISPPLDLETDAD